MKSLVDLVERKVIQVSSSIKEITYKIGKQTECLLVTTGVSWCPQDGTGYPEDFTGMQMKHWRVRRKRAKEVICFIRI